MNTRHRAGKRKGSVLVLCVFMMIAAFAILAFAVDGAYLHLVSSQLQRSADSAALAAASQLVDNSILDAGGEPPPGITNAQAAASRLAGQNLVCLASPELAVEDVVLGRLADPYDPLLQISELDPTRFNAAWVRVRRTEQQNGVVQLFFARALGIDTGVRQADATAVFIDNFSGFGSPPSGGGNLMILPFALDKDTWDDLLAGVGRDSWTWENENVSCGSDGVLEINLFPQGTGSPGNRGTVDIGSTNNSTNDIARQILEGISAEDLEHHDGSLEFDENGELFLNGDTGISAGVKDELESIKGQPRIIPIFSDVSGPGNNAWYTIVEFAGVRIMEVKLTGNINNKRVIIQPAPVEASGGVANTGETQTSRFIHSKVWLIH